MAFSLLGLDTASLIVILAIILVSSVAILLISMKDIFPNFAAGIHLNRALKVGQEVRIGKYAGRVEKVEPLHTIIRNGKVSIAIPNSEIIKNPIEVRRPEKK